jgi:predicted NUDIX family phosphoesterase
MEFVFVAPREELFPTCYPQGFQAFRTPEEGAAFVATLARTGFFVERARAERTPAWKQVIPYCVVEHEGQVLLLRRRAKGGEARLHGKHSIGVGGHVNPVDHAEGDHAGGEALFTEAARREIAEEVEIDGAYDLRLVGYLNDDSNAVGAVHLGLVHVAHSSVPVRIREHEVLEGDLAGPDDIRQSLRRGSDFESWSRLLIAHLEEFVSVRAPATTAAGIDP